MQVKTSGLTGAALDWVVAKCEGVEYRWMASSGGDYNGNWWWKTRSYSTDWSQGGPIIEREKFERIAANVSGGFTVSKKIVELQDDDSFYVHWVHGVGQTPLIAAMRCYVASKFGDTVEIPDELV